MSDSMQSRKEIREAIEAGERALTSLDEASKSLDKAKGYGIWDILGGGFISGMLKHSNLDKAQNQLENARYELNRFKIELDDVFLSYDVTINFDEFSRLADYFLDGFLIDIMIQSEINKNYDKILEVKVQVQTLLYRLKELEKGAN